MVSLMSVHVVTVGLPVWQNNITGIEFRSSNDLWKEEMGRSVKDMAALAIPYLAKNGGPIIMAQIENEYNWNDEPYIDWCGELAASLQLHIPWVICNGHSANDTRHKAHVLLFISHELASSPESSILIYRTSILTYGNHEQILA